MFVQPSFRSYHFAVKRCLEMGQVVPSRVGAMDSLNVGQTKEFRNLIFEFSPGTEFTRPGYSRRLAVLEALHLLSGTFDEGHFRAVAPKVGSGMFTPQMAYGPRVQPHLVRITEELKANPHSRRAVIFVSDNGSWPPPCTSSFQWLIRDDRLEMVTTMRSWDLWLGLPYDLFMFGALHLAMSGALGIPVGRSVVQAASAHLYENKWVAAAAATAEPTTLANSEKAFDVQSRDWYKMGGDGDTRRYWDAVKAVAEAFLQSCPWPDGDNWLTVQHTGLVRFR